MVCGKLFYRHFLDLQRVKTFAKVILCEEGGEAGGVAKSAWMTEARKAGAKILDFIKALPYIFAQPGVLYSSFFFYGEVLPILPVRILIYQGS